MTTLDWSRPIVTNAGKPAKVTGDGASRSVSGKFYHVLAKWASHGSPYTCHIHEKGWVQYGGLPEVRNATPAEILAHPEVWPEWQDWARENAVMMQGPATYAKANPQPTPNWLTPQTAIGCTLPCGAKVVRAETIGERGNIFVYFDRAHNGWRKNDRFEYAPSGKHAYNGLPNLIPAAPTPQPITHAAILAAVETLPEHAGPAEAADHIARAIGVDVPVKRAPWEVAYEAWNASFTVWQPQPKVWQAAVEWCVEQINQSAGVNPDDLRFTIRRAIMGQDNSHE
jgi:hypothetical protein